MTVADAFPASLSIGGLLAMIQAFLSNPAVTRLIITTFTLAISGWFVVKIRELLDYGWEKRKRQFSKAKDWVSSKSGKSNK